MCRECTGQLVLLVNESPAEATTEQKPPKTANPNQKTTKPTADYGDSGRSCNGETKIGSGETYLGHRIKQKGLSVLVAKVRE